MESKYALELVCTRMDKINKRMLIALILTVVMLFASNLAWLYAWMQYDYESDEIVTETVTVDGKDGMASYANHGGVVNNGQHKSSD